MIFDADVKIGESFKRTAFSAEDYLAEMERFGIDRAVVMAEKPSSYDLAAGNDYIETVISRYPDRFYGAVRVDPWNEEKALAELARRCVNPAFRAIYLNPWEENYQINSDIVRPVLDFAAEKKRNVIVEAGYVWVSHVSQIADIAGDYPGVNFLMANAGQMDLSGYSLTDVKYFIERTPNLYLGTAGAVAADWLVEIYRSAAPGRVIFETNYPFFEVRLEKCRIDVGFLNEEGKKAVFCGNAEQFFGVEA